MMLRMVICGKCAVKMKCSKNSKPVRINKMVCFFADEYTCPSCGAITIPVQGTYVDSDGLEDNAIDIKE